LWDCDCNNNNQKFSFLPWGGIQWHGTDTVERCLDVNSGRDFYLWTCDQNNSNQQFVQEFLSDISTEALALQPVDTAQNFNGQRLTWIGAVFQLAVLKSHMETTPHFLKVIGAYNNGAEIGTVSNFADADRWTRTACNQVKLYGTDKCIDLADGNETPGTKVQIWTCDCNNANQKFLLNPFNAIVLSKNTNRCLDFGKDGSSKVHLWNCDGFNFHQMFARIYPGSDDLFPETVQQYITTSCAQIKRVGTNRCLDVAGGQDSDGMSL
jgi:hypothetical protein